MFHVERHARSKPWNTEQSPKALHLECLNLSLHQSAGSKFRSKCSKIGPTRDLYSLRLFLKRIIPLSYIFPISPLLRRMSATQLLRDPVVARLFRTQRQILRPGLMLCGHPLRSRETDGAGKGAVMGEETTLGHGSSSPLWSKTRAKVREQSLNSGRISQGQSRDQEKDECSQRSLHRIEMCRLWSKGQQHKSSVISDSAGNLLTEEKAVLDRWTEYCFDYTASSLRRTRTCSTTIWSRTQNLKLCRSYRESPMRPFVPRRVESLQGSTTSQPSCSNIVGKRLVQAVVTTDICTRVCSRICHVDAWQKPSRQTALRSGYISSYRGCARSIVNGYMDPPSIEISDHGEDIPLVHLLEHTQHPWVS